MPNIEIHGLLRLRAGELADKVFDLFRGKPYLEETVVTIYPTIVKDVHGKDHPFIRVVNEHQLHTKEILEKLKTLGIDIEHLKLTAFIPRQKQ